MGEHKMDKKILLIADDDEMSREIIKKFFRDVYYVIEAHDGEEALDVIHRRTIDVVILDIMMPKFTGFEVLRTVKCDEKYKDLKVLVATSMQEKTERKALEYGADDIVFKPYDPVVIKKRIDNLLTMQEQKRELEHALEKAEMANQAKTDFLSRISHDMRTPLNGILGITTLLRDKILDKSIHQDLIQLEMSGHYLLNLINDTLDVNKIEIGKLELHPGVYDGRMIMNNIIDLIKPNMDEKKINFNVYVDDLPFNVLFMDMGRLEQVIMNILGNSVKFTPEGGTIDVYISNISVTDKIIKDRIVIKDNGIGMSKEFLPHLFESFSQENPGSTGNTTGTGLGMTITKQIIDLMGGSILVESDLGEGTTFTLELPMSIASDEQIKEWKEKKSIDVDHYNFAGKRVLICEDHPLNAQIAQRLLEKKEIIVEHATNGKEGIRMFEESEPNYYDLILMDVRMPEMDGIEATKRIREMEREDAYSIPIVAMTANAFYEDIRQVKDAGMDAHLGKPIEVDRLFRCLAQMLQLERRHIKKGILIVDDVALNRAAIKTALASEFAIYEASSGKETLKLLEEIKGISLVITDIQMPEMNGLELIKEIRSKKEYNHIRIIANTQFGNPEQEETILNLGADDFVYKPTTPKIVELRVRNIMNRI